MNLGRNCAKWLLGAGFLVVGLSGFALGAGAADDIRLMVNGKSADGLVRLIDDTSFIPLRAVVELLGATVEWNGETRTIFVTSSTGRDSEQKVYKAGPLTLRNVTTEHKDYGWSIAAEAMNTDDKSYKAIHLTAVYKDRNGKLIGIAAGTVFDLKPEETKTVKFASTDDLSDYTSIFFQTDFTY